MPFFRVVGPGRAGGSLVAALVALAGARAEARGAHTREDFPDTNDRRCRRILARPGQASGS